MFTKSLRALLILLAMAATAAWGQSANPPIGNRDDIVPSGNTYFTWGWTCDPDAWGQSLWVHFYIDGTYATGTYAGAVQANTERSDVYGVCNGTTAHGYGFYIPTQFMTPGTHYIYAYALDNGGAGPNPLLGGSPLSYTVTSNPPPSCSSAAPQAATTTATSGGFDLYAYGVQNATAVMFPTWAHSGQADLVWYPGVDLGGGTWKASVNMGQHFAGNPIYGTFVTHVYAYNPNHGYAYCAGTSFQRVQPATPPTCTSGAPQSTTTTATSGPFQMSVFGVQNATAVLIATWADPAQQDIEWYWASDYGGGTWRGSMDLGRHFTGNPIYGTFTTQVYAYNPGYGYSPCTYVYFQRTQQQQTYSISGRTGKPGAVVNVGGLTTTADANGAYTVSGLSAGTYAVSPSGAPARCTFVPASRSVSVGPSRTNEDFQMQCEKSWDPLITGTTSHYRACDQNDFCTYSGSAVPSWVFSNANEVPIPGYNLTHRVAALGQGQVDGFMTKGFEYKPGDGRWKVKLGMNKDSDPNSINDNNIPLNIAPGTPWSQVWFDTTYATAFFEDNYDVNSTYSGSPYPYPTLDQDLWIDFRAALLSHRVANPGTRPMPPNGLPADFPQVNGMSRVTAGITVSWEVNGQPKETRFLEVVLWRDDAYDACTPQGASWWGGAVCYDSIGRFDRSSSWGHGASIYLTGTSLGSLYSEMGLTGIAPVPQPLSVGGSNSYSLPIGALLKWYFSGPPNWNQAKLQGVYIGIETWGRATTYVDIDNYRLYSVSR